MTQTWSCKICGVEGELIFGAPGGPTNSDACEIEQPGDIFTFYMGKMHSIKTCRSCKEELGDNGLRDKIRKKLKRS